MADDRRPLMGPPHIIAMAKAEAYREVVELLAQSQPDDVREKLDGIVKKLEER